MAVTIELVGLDALRTRLQSMKEAWARAPRGIVHEAAEALKKALRQEAPVRSGDLRRGIHYRVEASGPAVVARFTDAQSYTAFVIHGTKPHDIFAGFYERNSASGKRALWWPGADHPTPYVHHPGTRPSDFPTRAMVRVGPEVRAILEEAGQALVSSDPIAAALWQAA